MLVCSAVELEPSNKFPTDHNAWPGAGGSSQGHPNSWRISNAVGPSSFDSNSRQFNTGYVVIKFSMPSEYPQGLPGVQVLLQKWHLADGSRHLSSLCKQYWAYCANSIIIISLALAELAGFGPASIFQASLIKVQFQDVILGVHVLVAGIPEQQAFPPILKGSDKMSNSAVGNIRKRGQGSSSTGKGMRLGECPA